MIPGTALSIEVDLVLEYSEYPETHAAVTCHLVHVHAIARKRVAAHANR